MKALAPLVFALLLISPAVAQETRTAAPGAVPPPARVADLAWLTGAWEGEGPFGPAREAWSPPTGDQMIGHFVQTGGDGVRFSEIVSIAETGGSLELRLKHFNADLTGWEEKDEVVRFPLVAVERDVWYFDGLTIRRDGPDGLVAAVVAENDEGPPRELAFRYRRVR